MKNVIIVAAAVLIIAISGCAAVYLPVASEDVEVSEDFGILKTEDYILAVSHKFWVKEPQELTDYFITFYLSFRNLSAEKVSIAPEDINLLDENGSQYDIVLPEAVLELLQPEEILFDQFNELDEEDDQIYESWKEAKNNLLMDTFNFGNILPGARKEGYVFFPRPASKNSSCRIVYNDLFLQFRKAD